ncbi:HAD hydrolase family protein [Collinsella vaginalis]|uniref:HAD family hydrolase n=1 Tax=Collinsella vaginalis TaxID=1870987 RepID=UPI0015C51417
MRYESNKALLFFDVDGTLVWRDVEAAKRGEQVPGYDEVRPSPAVENALARLREQGHKVFICTGRACARSRRRSVTSTRMAGFYKPGRTFR